MIKVLHVPFCFYPSAVGGTEIYVDSLARNLQPLGIESVIAAPGSSHDERSYYHDDLKVHRFPVAEESPRMLRELYGTGDPIAASNFGAILNDEKPDVVHLHAFTRGVSLRLVSEAKQRGIKVVFTYHTPTVSCQRGTLLRFGSEVCDGVLDRRVCTSCTLHGLGLNGTRGKLLGAIPPRVGRVLESAGLSGGMWTALRMSQLIELRHNSFRRLMQECDAVIALCNWGRELLLFNGVAAEKITLVRHGLPYEINIFRSPNVATDQRPLRVAFLGRLNPTKGPDILIQAIRSQPNLDLKLAIYGITQGAADERFSEKLKALAGNDSRISFMPAVPTEQVVETLRKYHLLAVPSRLLETGPLVVLEAFAAGIPALGSNLGGIAELITPGLDGLVVNDDSPETWAEEIQKIAADRSFLKKLTEGVKPPRSLADVANEMSKVYESALPNPIRSVSKIASHA